MNRRIPERNLQELDKYEDRGHFIFTPNDPLGKCCNAPTDRNGFYTVVALSKREPEIIYIGLSGHIKQDGTPKTRKGGMKDRIVNGDHCNGIPRRIAWVDEMKKENFESLEVYWWVTYDECFNICPHM